jgi:beta-lactamase regulating signal transducer with metallopeptidase domain
MTAWVGAEIAGAVANGIIEGLALAVLLWFALRLTPRAAAATRYGLCGLALAFVALLPLAQGWLPRLGAPVAARVASGHPSGVVTLTAGAWLIWLLGAWALGSLALMARVVWGLVALQGLKRRALSAPEHIALRFEEIMRACPGRRRARVLVSEEVNGPMAAGVVKPAVVLPAYLVEELSEAELDQVLTHELAHIRRWDDWTNLAAKIVAALLFFHPAVVWIGRRLALEREIACDDWVVGLTGTARPYATCLTRLATMHTATPQLAPGALAPRPQISMRVEALLAGGRDRRRRSSRGALAAAAATLGMAVVAAAPWAPVTVAVPVAPVIAARRATPLPVVAARPVAARPVAAAVKTARVQRRAVARSSAPLRAVVARNTEVAGTSPFVEAVTPAPAAPAPALRLYVIYVNGGDAGWIRILWVHEIAVPALHRT